LLITTAEERFNNTQSQNLCFDVTIYFTISLVLQNKLR